MKLILVCGARPNFMKVAPLIRAIEKHNTSPQSPVPIHHLLVHTGQHYDYEMSQIFFEDLELPQPDIYLGVGSGTHAEQTGKVMIGFEKVLLQEKPDLVVVVGDVNSTLAAALAAVKLHIPLAHVEAGLRFYDLTMPEEVNRLLTDAISDYLFTPSPDADENLKREGIPEDRIFLVGNIMVDSLLQNKGKAEKRNVFRQLGLKKEGYAVLTLHRPDNVDDGEKLAKILEAVQEVSRLIPVVFPAHPLTQKRLKEFDLLNQLPTTNHQPPVTSHQLLITGPLGYLDFLNLEMNAKFVVTDSGGMQAETTILNIPCLTLYYGTGWTATVAEGTNTVVGVERERIIEEVDKILAGKGKKGTCPKLWDGRTAERIVEIIKTKSESEF